MFNDTKIKKKIDNNEFNSLIHKESLQKIECTPHTFFRLNEKQREIFTCKELKKVLLTKTPFLIGLQYNNNYAVFYKYQKKNLKIILNIGNRNINIVTFYFIQKWQIPKL